MYTLIAGVRTWYTTYELTLNDHQSKCNNSSTEHLRLNVDNTNVMYFLLCASQRHNLSCVAYLSKTWYNMHQQTCHEFGILIRKCSYILLQLKHVSFLGKCVYLIDQKTSKK